MRPMEILFIQPSHLRRDGSIHKSRHPWTPALTLPYIAALTPREHRVQIIDECVDRVEVGRAVDLVAITSMTVQAPRAYQIADRFRECGVPVVMGGFHVSALPEEALAHCDAVVVGEAEQSWNAVLDDLSRGALRSVYTAEALHDLRGLPVPRYDLVDLRPYRFPLLSVQATRGCRHSCEFCSVSRHYGAVHRCRPVEEVVEEVRAIRTNAKARLVFFVDDNIIADRSYAGALLEALIPLKLRWLGQFSLHLGLDPRLLRLAQRSGCIGAYVGIESIDPANLRSVNKAFNRVGRYREALDAMRRHGIAVQASIIAGLEHDSVALLRATERFVAESRVPIASVFILTPFPGTPLRQRMEREGRIRSTDWSELDNTQVTFEPKNIAREELQAWFWGFYRRFYSLRAVFPRLLLTPPRNLILVSIWNLLSWLSLRNSHHPMLSPDVRGHLRLSASLPASLALRRFPFGTESLEGVVLDLGGGGARLRLAAVTGRPPVGRSGRLAFRFAGRRFDVPCRVVYSEDGGAELGLRFRGWRVRAAIDAAVKLRLDPNLAPEQ
jgi:radical SAM superfamily enzyme YgiQ (UPF0313 family)